jgi:uncharacterized membrane protein (UPF0127 family)
MEAVLKTADGTTVCDRCVVARTPLSRMKGLLGRTGLSAGEGLLLQPAQAIHTAFMKFSIDAIFLDRNLRVLAVESHLKPWRAAGRRKARFVLELGAGETARLSLEPGVALRCEELERGRDGAE